VMRIDLSGKRALVTGSTAGIGFAIARGLIEAGAAVVINGRSGDRVAEALARLGQEMPGGNVQGVATDASDAEGAATLVRQLPEVDILVNNLGIFEPKPFFDIEDDDWLKFFQTNVLSGVRLARAYGQAMASRGWGRIVFISSESALQIPTEMIHYGMTKTAQLAVSRGLAETLAGTGVTVNAVLPGPTRSEGVSQFVAQLAREQGKSEPEVEREFFTTMRPTSLIGRFAEVEEVANMVVYLCSTQASATTGAAVRVDGGVVRSIP
jgi:NAD(P)-dependent dehydrogenase (short-subunit alcohol dehydrogenase family)